MKRRHYVDITILFILLNISGCVTKEIPETGIMEDAIMDDVFFNRSTSCDMIQTDWKRDNCYYQVAVYNTQNESFCMKMQDSVGSLYTRDQCLKDVLMKKDKISPGDCMKISLGDKRDACLEKSALDNMDLSICDKIDEEVYRMECKLDMIRNTSDFTKCDSVFKEDEIFAKSDCYWEAARATKDVTWCDKIPSDDSISCKADLKEDINLCNSIADTKRKYACMRLVAIKKNDTELCNSIPSDDFEFDYCIMGIAKDRTDRTLCETLQRNITRETCILQIETANLTRAVHQKIANLTSSSI